MWYKFISFLIGWYTLKTNAEASVVLINLLHEHNIKFWGAKTKDNIFYLNFSVFSYESVISCTAEIQKSVIPHGLSFIIYRYRKRYGLIAGGIAGLLIMFLSSLIVWDIEVTGNKSIADGEIIAVLSENGLSAGSYIPDINTVRYSSLLLKEIPDLSSASVIISGTHITVDVIERRRATEMCDYSGTYDVVASADGIVTSIEAYDGKPLVNTGDAVIKGQVLISGMYNIGDDGYLSVTRHARGKVYASSVYEFIYTVPLEFTYRHYTGRTDKKVVYNILGNGINMFLGKIIPFAHYETVTEAEEMQLAFVKLPGTKYTLYSKEYVPALKIISVAEAKEKALAAFNAWCANDISGFIGKTSYEFIEDTLSNSVTIHGVAEVINDIAEERKIDIMEHLNNFPQDSAAP